MADVTVQGNNFSVRGSLDGHSIGVVHGATLQATVSGGGAASQIGRFTFALNAAVDLTNGASTGVFLLVFSNGDVFYGSFTGVGGPTSTPNVGHIVEQLTITGGTGRFQGATGSIALDRVVDESTLPAFESHSGTLTGTINTPPKIKYGGKQGVSFVAAALPEHLRKPFAPFPDLPFHIVAVSKVGTSTECAHPPLLRAELRPCGWR